MTEAYPLHWPDGWPRTPDQQRKWSLAGGRSGTQPFGRTRDRLLDELRRLGARGAVLSTDRPLRRDGLPYANKGAGEDPGVAVYFTLNDRQMVIAQDAYELMEDNIRSLALAIEHMRGLERHGGGHMMERAFAGFEALPAPGVTDWRHVLGSGITTRAEAETRYRKLARERHPDAAGGSEAAMADLNVAIEQARQELTDG